MSRRLDHGGTWIDRSNPLRFTFDGVEYEGFEGDTLASALLANDVVGGFRSPILGRPRGIYSAGVEEPNAFVEISEPWFDPIVAATMVELVDGLVAHSRAGVGRLPAIRNAVPGRRTEHLHAQVETLVIGGGPSGRSAAIAASSRGDRVLLLDEWHRIDDVPRRVTALSRTTALGMYDDGYVVAHERLVDLERLRHIRARRVVLATGAHERPIAFANCDLPGVMLASAARAYVERFGVLPGRQAAVLVTNDSGLEMADVLRSAGAEVVALADVRKGEAVSQVVGDAAVEAVLVRDADGTERTVKGDLVAIAGGWNPAVQLWRASGGALAWDEDRACFVPDGTGPRWLDIVGRASGEDLPVSAPYWFVSADDLSTHFVDLQRDQTVVDVMHAVDAGLRSVEHVKRATYIGTAVDQGRTSGVLTAGIVNALQRASADSQGPTNARPPYVPVSYAAVAGPYRGPLLDPVRTTSMHDLHVERGAVFEDVGQWKRPWYFPRKGESMDEAVARECLAVRNDVGAMDASTLGKIEVVGPDAPVFLDRMYTNRMSNLKTGSIRYGLMCGLDGMVFDDGVAMRLADDRYLVTTTTGGAAGVLDHFEEWLQTEWTDLSVFCTSVTEQWAVLAVNGPRAREVISTVGTDIDLAKGAFPHMTFRDGFVAGVPARLARVSFSGELAFEIHVKWWHGAQIWDRLLSEDVSPYGTESMHVLRAEKGYVIVGQDTDGTVTPFDLGMDWIVNPSKGDFIGRRSFSRADTARKDRKQLIGLLPDDPKTLLPEGAQLVLNDTGTIPMPMVGHVTSSYRSGPLGRTFALAMLERGHEMHGEKVYAPLEDETIVATVTTPVLYDPEGARLAG
jgi:sarcosine oxidase, subunit alpha